jgi:hypothetical protein
MINRGAFVILVVALLAWSVPAQAQQSFDVNLGVFAPKPEDSRVEGDVLAINRAYLYFEFADFTGFLGEAAVSTELGRYFEASVGFGGYQRTVPTVYADKVFSDGREIEQDLKLRILPLTAMLRIFPIGHRRAVQPYIGVGIAANFWRYSETGEFVDFVDDSIYRAAYVANGTAFGPVGVFGVRGRLTPQMDLGLEARLSWAEAELNEDFLGDKLDLGGGALLATLKFRF